jgi:hypothetical protein
MAKARGANRARRVTPLGERIGLLVLQFYGSQRAAARAWGTTRGTLDRILAGEVEIPRGNLLVRIAKACGTSTDWLLTGDGPRPQPPHEPVPSHALDQWKDLVERLGVDDITRDALLLLPGRVRRAFAQLLVWDPITRGDKTPFTNRQLIARRRAEDLEVQAWTELLRLVLDRYGPEETRRVLQQKRALIAIGFSTVAHLFLVHLAQLDDFDGQRIDRALTSVVTQAAMVFHPREMSLEEQQVAVDPFGPPAAKSQFGATLGASGGSTAIAESEGGLPAPDSSVQSAPAQQQADSSVTAAPVPRGPQRLGRKRRTSGSR